LFYSEAVYRPLGDLYLTIEFGDELNLLLNFKVIALDAALKANPIVGITETIPTNRSLGLVYDPFVIDCERLIGRIKTVERGMGEISELTSRLVTIPIWYNDPWSLECALAAGFKNNVEYMAEINGMTVEGIIETHAGTQWWVSAVGFQPATYQALPLDPAFNLTAPKYPRPRKTTPERILCQAGKITSFYPVVSPGGYQLLGRTPLDLYDPKQRNPVFKDGPVLPRVGDRHRYVPIDETKYWNIRRQCEAGTYAYEIKEEIYRLRDYLDVLAAHKKRVGAP
jgi:KipI family sensor histidine kinase inhibitor